MKGKIYKMILSLFLLFGTVCFVYGQAKVSGSVIDSKTKEMLIGVHIIVKSKIIGTTTGLDGKFALQTSVPIPFTLIFSVIGYGSQEVEVTQDEQTIDLALEIEASILGQEVVISASKVEESILKSPVSIEKMNILDIKNSASDSYYKGLATLKGLDMTSSSINFQVINARGFNSTSNTRFVQLADGMDTQAPALNFPIGSLNSPSSLDIESIEFLPGSASALYGPNAFNGILLINSKSPFQYKGFSFYAKTGMNHFGSKEGEPSNPKPMYEFSLRWAKSLNDRFAFKINLTTSKAEDWYGTERFDKNPERQGNLLNNPGANMVHFYGDEVATNLGLLGISPRFVAVAEANGLGAYLGDLPNQVVTRTPYAEADLVNYNAKNIKFNTALHYRLKNHLELIYQLNYGSGTSVYTGAQRYSLQNFFITQNKLELKADNFYIRAYQTQENSGDSYIGDLIGVNVNNAWANNSVWYTTYGLTYLGALAQGGIAPGTANTLLADINNGGLFTAFHDAARAGADVNRYLPGSAAFNETIETNKKGVILDGGAKFDDKTSLYHLESQYNFKNQFDFMDLQIGLSYRLYQLASNGTVFPDSVGNDITISEYGAYMQVAKKLMNDKLKLTGSIRFDKNENFDGQINPRISGVYAIAENHNFRTSYQTGFRNPTTQGQHIDLDIISGRLLGGLPQYSKHYNIYENAYTSTSVEAYTAAVAAAGSVLGIIDPANLALLVPITKPFEPVIPERVRSIEFGYKGLINNNILIDVAYYSNSYDDFITQVRVRKAAGDVSVNPFNAQTLLTPTRNPSNTHQVYTNNKSNITAKGAIFGINYSSEKGYAFGFNYNWNKLDGNLGEGFLSEFNTPEHKVNLTFGNRKLTKDLGFNIAFRWQEAFKWESSFVQGPVPSYATVDAQVSYNLKSIKSVFKLGGSNLLNKRYIQNFGGPTMGAIYYFSITFDEFLN